jgi:hypothetical protein
MAFVTVFKRYELKYMLTLEQFVYYSRNKLTLLKSRRFYDIMSLRRQPSLYDSQGESFLLADKGRKNSEVENAGS